MCLCSKCEWSCFWHCVGYLNHEYRHWRCLFWHNLSSSFPDDISLHQAFEAYAVLYTQNIWIQTPQECKIGNIHIWPLGFVAFSVKDPPLNRFVCDFWEIRFQFGGCDSSLHFQCGSKCPDVWLQYNRLAFWIGCFNSAWFGRLFTFGDEGLCCVDGPLEMYWNVGRIFSLPL